MKNYKIDPGELNKRITIYRITGQKDAAGRAKVGAVEIGGLLGHCAERRRHRYKKKKSSHGRIIP